MPVLVCLCAIEAVTKEIKGQDGHLLRVVTTAATLRVTWLGMQKYTLAYTGHGTP